MRHDIESEILIDIISRNFNVNIPIKLMGWSVFRAGDEYIRVGWCDNLNSDMRTENIDITLYDSHRRDIKLRELGIWE